MMDITISILLLISFIGWNNFPFLGRAIESRWYIYQRMLDCLVCFLVARAGNSQPISPGSSITFLFFFVSLLSAFQFIPFVALHGSDRGSKRWSSTSFSFLKVSFLCRWWWSTGIHVYWESVHHDGTEPSICACECMELWFWHRDLHMENWLVTDVFVLQWSLGESVSVSDCSSCLSLLHPGNRLCVWPVLFLQGMKQVMSI